MNFDALVIFIIFSIIWPLIKGLMESNKKRRDWQKRQEIRKDIRPETKKPEPAQSRPAPVYGHPTVDEAIVTAEETKYAENVQTHLGHGARETGTRETKELKNVSAADEVIDLEHIFTKNNLLGGIILKEVLEPPRSVLYRAAGGGDRAGR